MKLKRVMMSLLMLMIISATLNAQNRDKLINAENLPELEIQTSDAQKFRIGDSDFEMSDILKYIIENNNQVRILLYDAAMADTDSKSFNAKYMPVLFASGTYDVVNYPEDAQRGAMSGEGYTEKTGKAGIQKSFSTGTTVTAGLQQKYYDNEKLSALYGDPEYYQNGYFVQIEQELLKNVLGYQDRKQKDMLKNAETVKNEIAVYNISLISVDAVLSVWDYALAYSTFSNMKLKLDETRKVRTIVRSNVNLGVNERYYLNYWNALVASNEVQYSRTEQTLKQKERDLIVKFNFDEEHTRATMTGAPGEEPPIIAVLTSEAPVIDADVALNNALENRADYRQAVLNVQNAKNGLDILENESLPSLKAGVSMSSIGQRDGYSDAYSDAFAGDYKNYGASITLSYPLYNVKLKTDKRNAEMKLEQAKINADNTRKQVEKDILNGIDAVNVAYESYQKAKQTRLESERYYMGFRQHLSSGRFSAADIKNALDAMIDSRTGELQALVYYNVTLLQFDIVQNSLFKSNDINIDEVVKGKRK